MMLKLKNKGFTLIELMVVIVIIGVLASLAIPRFTEASDKAKAADAPRVLASFESAYSAAVAELGGDATITSTELIFKLPENSKWFSYTFDANTNITLVNARAESKMGQIGTGTVISSTYCTSDDSFSRNVVPAGTGAGTYADIQKKYYSSFLPATFRACPTP